MEGHGRVPGRSEGHMGTRGISGAPSSARMRRVFFSSETPGSGEAVEAQLRGPWRPGLLWSVFPWRNTYLGPSPGGQAAC